MGALKETTQWLVHFTPRTGLTGSSIDFNLINTKSPFCTTDSPYLSPDPYVRPPPSDGGPFEEETRSILDAGVQGGSSFNFLTSPWKFQKPVDQIPRESAGFNVTDRGGPCPSYNLLTPSACGCDMRRSLRLAKTLSTAIPTCIPQGNQQEHRSIDVAARSAPL